MSHRLRSSVVSLGSASLGLLAASLTLHGAGCGASDTSLYTRPGVCPPSFDDGNPCTLDACPNGTIIHEVVFDGAPCALGQNSGTCKQGLCELACLSEPASCKCGDPLKDCPADTACMGWLCEDAHCKANPRTDTVRLAAEQTSGDCKKIVCTAAGEATPAPDDGDKPGDDGPCTIGMCTDGTPTPFPRDVGDACGGGQTGVCDSMSNCVACVEGTANGCSSGQQCYKAGEGKLLCAPMTCFDHGLDGNETDEDCGGSCKPCAQGGGCLVDPDCGDRTCASILGTTQKVCCELPCTGVCKSCAQGTGTCDDAATGTLDPRCAPLQVCAKGVGCAFRAGYSCEKDEDCMSGICNGNKQCAPGGITAPCVFSSDCSSQNCDPTMHTCQPQ